MNVREYKRSESQYHSEVHFIVLYCCERKEKSSTPKMALLKSTAVFLIAALATNTVCLKVHF